MLITSYPSTEKPSAHAPDTKEFIPDIMPRQAALDIPTVAELDVVRHYTKLSQKNFSIDTNFYPLGSCTMKYNPKATNEAVRANGFRMHHPLQPECKSQGLLSLFHELQLALSEVTGLSATSLTPMAGAQGELAGVKMIKSYHEQNNDHDRCEMIVPTAAHGTNPASAAMAGFKIIEVPVDERGNVNLEALKPLVGPKTAGIMLTNPSTCGVFEENIIEVAKLVHDVGGLLYYDGANLNAILGVVRPGDMGFDVVHLNVHKTFATPHGGGGPGAGPVVCNDRLHEFLPGPIAVKNNEGYNWHIPTKTIGRMSAFMGNTAVLLRALAYIRLLGAEGLRDVGRYSTLNANYLLAKLADMGYEPAYPRRASHEFLLTLKKAKDQNNVSALNVAKRLLDFGLHSPTMYFPLIVPECLLIEPTETESLATLDNALQAFANIMDEITKDPDSLQRAPRSTKFSRFDEAAAAKKPVLTES